MNIITKQKSKHVKKYKHVNQTLFHVKVNNITPRIYRTAGYKTITLPVEFT